MTQTKALKLALEAMRGLYGGWRCESAIKACEEALAQPEQEKNCNPLRLAWM